MCKLQLTQSTTLPCSSPHSRFNNMALVQRSKNGCWTCRLRRKKCDEGGPPYLNCQMRKIFCHGYGPKPDWKDRGVKEREEANKLLLESRTSGNAAVTVDHSTALPESNTAADLDQLLSSSASTYNWGFEGLDSFAPLELGTFEASEFSHL